MPMDGRYATGAWMRRSGYAHGRSRTSMFFTTLVLPVQRMYGQKYVPYNFCTPAVHGSRIPQV